MEESNTSLGVSQTIKRIGGTFQMTALVTKLISFKTIRNENRKYL